MRRLARELDTGPASLYVYVDNMADLHGAVLDRLFAGIDLRPCAPSGSWRARLAGLLVAYTELLFAHPSLARSVLTLRLSGPNYLRLADSVLVLLRNSGGAGRRAAVARGLRRGASRYRLGVRTAVHRHRARAAALGVRHPDRRHRGQRKPAPHAAVGHRHGNDRSALC